METKVSEKLRTWQERVAQSDKAYADDVQRMQERERLYQGDTSIKPLVAGDTKANGRNLKTPHVHNICFENIESQISSNIPAPKVTPMRKEDEPRAEMIERMLRNITDKLPFEAINDLAERMVPIQGAAIFHIEWDNTKQTHNQIGQLVVKVIHPKQLAPQPGVFTSIEDMDWVILKIPTTKTAIRRKYGVNVDDEGESEPEVRTTDNDQPTTDAVTQYIGYERNDEGGIDRYSWVNDIELEDLDNYQARRQPVCSHCGKTKPLYGQIISTNVPDTLSAPPQGVDDQTIAAMMMAGAIAGGAPEGETPLSMFEIDATPPEPKRYDGGPCPYCGADDWSSEVQDYEQIMLPITTGTGQEIPGMTPGLDENGMPVMKPTLVPFYKPDQYPLVMQRSVSVFGQLYGNSDIDVIATQQNTINRLSKKIIDRLVKAGTRITLPPKGRLRVDTEDSEVWYLEQIADKAFIDVYEFKGDLQYEMAYMAKVYEEARQMLGITDSFQGRVDRTATSGKAKEFSAAQAAGRLQSKREMKKWAYSEIYRMMFQFMLAYSDEPRPVVYKDFQGKKQYDEFSRYDFLEKDANGEWYWDDEFLFSADNVEALANNREAMWQETRANLQAGAFGNPQDPRTLILFWGKMEELHYPGAAETKAYLEDLLAQQQQQMQQQMQMQQAQAAQAQFAQQAQAVDRQAYNDALAAVQNRNMQGTP